MNRTRLYLILIVNLFFACNCDESKKDKAGRLITDLIIEKKVELHFFQSSIKMIKVGLEINTWNDLKILIPAGTNLIPNDDSVQTMVCIQNIEVIAEDDWVQIDIPVACSNLPKKIPNNSSKFRIEVKSKNNEINQLFDYIKNNNLKLQFEIVQSATWIISDNASYYDLKGLRIKKDQFDLFGESVILPKMAAEGIRLCNDVGIDVTSKEIYKNFNNIYMDLGSNDRLKYDFLIKN